MKKFSAKTALFAFILTMGATAAHNAMADTQSYLDNRVTDQNDRIEKGVANGTETQAQADRQYGRDAVATKEINNGHDLAAERELNKNSRRIHYTKHN